MASLTHIIYSSLSALAPIVLAAAGTAAVVGCSQSDILPGDGDTGVEGYSISFGATDTAVETTRATSSVALSTLGYDEITVYGYKTIGTAIQNVMPGYTLKYTPNSANTSTTNTTGWEYVGQGTDYLGNAQEIKYWDGNSTDYRFFAVLPNFKNALRYGGEAISASTVMAADKSFSLEFSGLEYLTHALDGKYYASNGAEVPETKIPMYGTLWQGDPAAYYKQPVELSFVKPYALVRLVFERPAGTSTTQLGREGETASYITFAPKDGSTMTGDGKVDVSWSMTDSRETATATAGTATLPTMTLNPLTLTDQETRYQAWPEYLMIPTTSAPVDFKCTAHIFSNGSTTSDKREAVIPAAYMKWKPGYQYTYVFKITSNNTLEFSHAVEVYTRWQAGYSDQTEW